MQFQYTRAMFVAAWLLAIGAVGIAINLTSIPSWTVLTGLGLLPLLVVLRFWKYPPQSMSESIQKVLR